MTVTSDIRNLKFQCPHVLSVGFAFLINMILCLAWSSSARLCIVLFYFVTQCNNLDSNGFFCDSQTLTPWLQGAWALHWNMMLINALTILHWNHSSHLQFDVIHPSHIPTLIYISQMCQERAQDGERKILPRLQWDCVAQPRMKKSKVWLWVLFSND